MINNIASFEDAGELPQELRNVVAVAKQKPNRVQPVITKPGIGKGLDVVPLSEVEEEEVDWLLEPYLPIGKITLVAGDPGVGKTFFLLAVAAAVSTGRVPQFTVPVEGQEPVALPPAQVLYLSAEDGASDTLKPRFRMQHGDESRLYTLNAGGSGYSMSQFQLLDETLTKLTPRLVVIDPLQAFLGSKVDMHRANEVRPILEGVAKLAAKHHCAIVLLLHLNKSTKQNAQYRILGSIDILAAVRSALLAGHDPNRQDGFALAHIKSTCARRGQSILYSIHDDGLHWNGLADISADSIIQGAGRAVGQGSSIRSGRVVEAISFLQNSLQNGPVPTAALKAAAIGKGISVRSLDIAKHETGVIHTPDGLRGKWTCRLPANEEVVALPSLAEV